MRKLLLIAILLVPAGCAKLQPVLVYTCMGCQGLVASGACRNLLAAQPNAPPIPIPECQPGEVTVVSNWKQVCEQGATPVLTCEKP